MLVMGELCDGHLIDGSLFIYVFFIAYFKDKIIKLTKYRGELSG
jgi:hypothetical protein